MKNIRVTKLGVRRALAAALGGMILWCFTAELHANANQDVTPGSAAPKSRPARVALVASGASEPVRNLLDLAVAKLSEAKEVHLLERAAIDRALAEQKLSLAGFVDAATAVRAGQLLGANLFAVLEASATDKQALGLVVYDAGTSIKLWDSTLAGKGLDDAAASVAAGVRGAAAKWAAGLKKLKTVCFLAVRNADLPSDKNSFCQALAAILERRLASSAAVALLERKRLEFVNIEKGLVPELVRKDLLASLVRIDLQISRATQGDGLQALAFLTDHQGKQLARLSAQSKEPDIVALAQPLLEQIRQALALPMPAGVPVAVGEGRRFDREARLLLSHNLYIEALQAAESAYALAPAEPDHAALLSQCLITAAIYLANPTGIRTVFYGKHLIKVEPAKLKEALRLARRGFEMRANTLARLSPRTRLALGRDQGVNIHTTETQRIFRNHLPFYDPAAFDAEAKELRQEFLAASRRLVLAEVNAWADAARADPAAFSNYTVLLLQRFLVIHEEATDPEDFTTTLTRLVRAWLQIAQSRAPAKMEPAHLVWFLDDLERFALHPYPPRWKLDDAARGQLLDLFKTMEGATHPLIALCGRHGRLELRLAAKQIDAAKARDEFHRIFAAVLDLLKSPPPWLNTEYRAAFYKFATRMMGHGTLHSNSIIHYTDLQALCAFMVDRGEIVTEVVDKALLGSFYPDKLQKGRLELIQRALALADSPRCRFLQKGQEAWIKRQLLVAWDQVLTAKPGLRGEVRLPWDPVQALLDLSKNPGQARIHGVKVVGSQAYAAVCGFEKDRAPYVQVIRVAVLDGAPEFLGKARVRLPRSPVGGRPSEGSFINFITGLAVGRDTIFVGTENDGIYAFPASGAPPRRLGAAQGLPAEGVTALAILGETVYAGLRDGYFVAIDQAGERSKVLASSQRKEKLSPFDDGSAFTIPYVVADPPRERVLFILYQGMPSTANRTDGLWEYSAKSRTFTQRLVLWRHANLREGSDVHGGRIVLSGFVATYLVSFDLERNQAALLSEAYPIGPNLKAPDLKKRAEPFDAFPYLCLDGWVWTARPFGRKTVDGSKREIFPRLRTKQSWTSNPFVPRWLERIEHGPWVLIGDPAGLWAVRLRPSD